MKLNPGVSLPDLPISVVHLGGVKGSSYVLSDFLSKTNDSDVPSAFLAPDVAPEYAWRTRSCEQFARVKTVLDIYVFHKQPDFLGQEIAIGAESRRNQ